MKMMIFNIELLTNSGSARQHVDMAVVYHGPVLERIFRSPYLRARWFVCVHAVGRASVVTGLVSAHNTEIVQSTTNHVLIRFLPYNVA